MSGSFHANLLIGEIEAGRKTVLHEIAGALCGAENAPCGHCLSCKRILEEHHPDVHILDPGKKAIRVADLRDFLEEENVRPFEAAFKCYVILHAETLNTTCQNAILKTLEEPSGDTRFYLVAENTDALLPTIISRCAIRRVEAVTTEELARRLQSIGMEKERAWIAASLANGSYQKALETAQNETFYEIGSACTDALCHALCGDMTAMSELYTYIQKKDGAMDAVTWWQMLLQDLFGCAEKREEHRFLYTRPAAFEKAASRYSGRQILRLIRSLEITREQLLENVNASLAADGFFSAVLKEIHQ